MVEFVVDTGLKTEVMEGIADCARAHGLDVVVLFGSRARGDHRPKSDVDLAVSGGDQTRFVLDVEERVPTLLKFDFVNLDGPVQQELREAIAWEGVTIYEKVR